MKIDAILFSDCSCVFKCLALLDKYLVTFVYHERIVQIDCQ